MALKKRQAFKVMKFYLRCLGVNPNETRRQHLLFFEESHGDFAMTNRTVRRKRRLKPLFLIIKD